MNVTEGQLSGGVGEGGGGVPGGPVQWGPPPRTFAMGGWADPEKFLVRKAFSQIGFMEASRELFGFFYLDAC